MGIKIEEAWQFSIHPRSGLRSLGSLLPRTAYGVTIVQPLWGFGLAQVPQNLK